jgi:hypothetical protein
VNCINKKILTVSILAMFMLVTISFASAVEHSSITNVEKKDSPLYKMRIQQAISGNKFSPRDWVLIISAILIGLSFVAIIGSVTDNIIIAPGQQVFTRRVLPTSCLKSLV